MRFLRFIRNNSWLAMFSVLLFTSIAIERSIYGFSLTFVFLSIVFSAALALYTVLPSAIRQSKSLSFTFFYSIYFLTLFYVSFSMYFNNGYLNYSSIPFVISGNVTKYGFTYIGIIAFICAAPTAILFFKTGNDND